MSEQNELPERVWLPPEVARAMSEEAPPDAGDVLYIRATTPVPVDAARKAAEEIVEMIEAEREPYPEWSKNARRKYRDMVTAIIAKHFPSPVDAEAVRAECERIAESHTSCQDGCYCGSDIAAEIIKLKSLTTVPSREEKENK